MMEIVDILFSPRVTEDDAAYLAALISDHHVGMALWYDTGRCDTRLNMPILRPWHSRWAILSTYHFHLQ